MNEETYMRLAIELARRGAEQGQGGPFGAVIVKDGKIVGQGNNQVLLHQDPTAHAEVVAIRDACKNLGSFQLDGCTLYTSCEPCPMCMGAIYWARPERVFFACTRDDAAQIGFDDAFIYDELQKDNEQRRFAMQPLLRQEALEAFADWAAKDDKTMY